MNKKLCRLADGTFVVGELSDNILLNTLQLVMSEVEGRNAVNLIPLLYPFTNDHSGSHINSKFIISSIPCPNELANLHVQVTTGIIPSSEMPTPQRG